MKAEGTILRDGDAFGDFRIDRFIERDGLTETYLAQRDGAAISLRCLHLGRASEPPSARAFAVGVERLRSLKDEGVPEAYAGGVQDDIAWLATEHVPGRSLRDLFAFLEPNLVSLMLRDARNWASTIEAAHAEGVLHGDLRPESIVFDDERDEPRTMIVGIGCAELFGLKGEIAAQTPLYRAPEQILGRPIDERADVYSFGMILYELLALRPPFEPRPDARPNPLRMRTLAVQQAPTPLTKIHRLFPKFVAALVEKAIAKDPRDRFQRMGELVKELDDVAKRLERWTMIHNQAGEVVSSPERERLRTLLRRLPAREYRSGHRLSRHVQFALEGYDPPSVDPDGDTDPGGPPEFFLDPPKDPPPPATPEVEAKKKNAPAKPDPHPEPDNEAPVALPARRLLVKPEPITDPIPPTNEPVPTPPTNRTEPPSTTEEPEPTPPTLRAARQVIPLRSSATSIAPYRTEPAVTHWVKERSAEPQKPARLPRTAARKRAFGPPFTLLLMASVLIPIAETGALRVARSDPPVEKASASGSTGEARVEKPAGQAGQAVQEQAPPPRPEPAPQEQASAEPAEPAEGAAPKKKPAAPRAALKRPTLAPLPSVQRPKLGPGRSWHQQLCDTKGWSRCDPPAPGDKAVEEPEDDKDNDLEPLQIKVDKADEHARR